MAVKAAQGGGVVAGVRSLGGGVIALSWSIAWGHTDAAGRLAL